MAAIELDDVHLEYPLRDSLSLKEYVLTRVFRQPARSRQRTIHALRGVTLRIGLGERVAIIGDNGAGKSTLLRTIAGVYPTSAGRIRVAGSICSPISGRRALTRASPCAVANSTWWSRAKIPKAFMPTATWRREAGKCW